VSIALIAVVLWISRYWYVGEFGLYEDDLFRIPMILDQPWAPFLTWLREIAFNGNLGRMCHEALIYILAKAGWDIGGLLGMHLIGFCILFLNTVLFFLLLRRMGMPSFSAVSGALVFVLFPPDSTQVFLTHTIGIHPGMTCFLIGSHIFLAGRPLLGLIAVIPCLFIYESIYLLFLAIPLVALARKSMRWTMAASFVGLTSAVFGLLAYLRIITGDSRSVEAAKRLDGLLPDIVRNVLTGPFLCLKGVLVLPGASAPDLLFRAPAFLAIALLSGGVLWWVWKRDSKSASASPDVNGFWGNLPLQYVLIGFALLFLSYPLLFELNSTSMVGRGSRVHLAAVVGASLALSSVVWLLQRKLSTPRSSMLMTVVLAIFCGMMSLRAFQVQDDLRRVWKYQQALWTDIIRQSPDIAPGTLVLVPTTELLGNAGFWPWPWEQTKLAEFFYHFPSGTIPPRLFFMRNDWEERVANSGDLFDGVKLHVFRHIRPN
jgi:hypothetical protein